MTADDVPHAEPRAPRRYPGKVVATTFVVLLAIATAAFATAAYRAQATRDRAWQQMQADDQASRTAQ